METTELQLAPGGLREIRLPLPDERITTYISDSKELNAYWHDVFLLDQTPSYEDTLPYRLHSTYRILKIHIFKTEDIHITESLADNLELLQSIYPLAIPLLIQYANFLGITTRDNWKYSHGLFDPSISPSIYEILEYEQKLFDYAMHSYTTNGPIAARQELQTLFHFTLAEAQSVILQAKGTIKAEYDRDDNESRTLMRARLDDFIARSRDALDIRAEAAALRILTVVDGLSKTAPSNVNTNFTEVIARVEKEEEEKYIDPPSTDSDEDITEHEL